jgi:hypothetical protein
MHTCIHAFVHSCIHLSFVNSFVIHLSHSCNRTFTRSHVEGWGRERQLRCFTAAAADAAELMAPIVAVHI